MDKLAGRIIDFNDDPRFVTDLRAQGLYGTELVDISRLDELPDSAFAVKIASGGHVHRRFPIHNRVATQLSAAYYDAGRSDDAQGLNALPLSVAKIAGWHIGKACERFGLEWPAAARGLQDPGTKEARLLGDPSDTLDLVENELGFSSHAKVAEYAQARIAQEFDQMDPERRTFAVQALVKAAGHDAIDKPMLWDYIPKAHYGPRFQDGIAMRDNLVKRAEVDRNSMSGALLDQIVEELKVTDPREAPRLLAQFDKLAGLDTRYKEGLPDPYQTCWGGFSLPKAARASIDASVDTMLGPKQASGTREEYQVDLEQRFPAHDVSFPKLAAVAQAVVDNRPWPEPYKAAVRRHFA